jgi:hypothetical protein
MFSLTSREQFLVVGILAAMVTGVAVEHWRDARREVPGAIAASYPAEAPPEPARPGLSAKP